MTRKAEPSSKCKSKALLLDVAKRLFSESGFHGVSVHDIARESGLNVSGIHYHFGDKTGLYRNCLEDLSQKMVQSLVPLLDQGMKATELEQYPLFLRLIAVEMLRIGADERHASQILLAECDRGMANNFDIFKKTFFKFFSSLIEYFQLLKKKKYLKASCDPLAIARCYVGVLSHTIRMDAVHERLFQSSIKTPLERERFADQMIQIFIHGIQNEKTDTQVRTKERKGLK